jgi:23S rRNA (uracil1939-C5)-methyltransferase
VSGGSSREFRRDTEFDRGVRKKRPQRSADPFGRERGSLANASASGGTRSPASHVSLLIEDVAYGGAGVGRHEGVVYFVPGTIPGERVEVEVLRKRKNFCEARLVSILERSPKRIEPPCPYFGTCGGCAYQHVSYADQLEWKRKQVRDLFRKIGRIPDPPVQAVLSCPREWNYRNRIRVHVRDGRVGFFQRGAHRLVEVERCALASERVNQRLLQLRRAPGEDRELTLAERPGISHFEQTNDFSAEILCGVLEEFLPRNAEVLVDAYAGAGFFGHRFASRFTRVVGIEAHRAAVEAARARAGDRERYVQGDVQAVLPSVLRECAGCPTVVLLDPPAEGLALGVVRVLQEEKPRWIAYVSCDAATQARDVRLLLEAGYRLHGVHPVDMFPQTADVEVVAFLEAPTLEDAAGTPTAL